MAWVLRGKIIYSTYAPCIGKEVEENIYGPAITDVVEDAQGRMWAFDDQENSATQIDFNPFTGEKAKTPRETK